MKRLLWLIILLGLAVPISAQVDLNGAAEAYNGGDFQTAIEIYELANAANQRSAALFYNLGNAYFEADLNGYAMVNYLRALYYAPRDSDTTLRIARVRSESTVTSTTSPNGFLQLANITYRLMTLRELSIIAILLWFTLGTCVVIANLRGRWRVDAIATVGVMGAIFALVAVLLFSRIWVQYQMPPAVVVDQSIPVYSGSDTSYLTLFDLTEASEVWVTERNGDFVKVLLPDGRRGWIDEVALIYPLRGL